MKKGTLGTIALSAALALGGFGCGTHNDTLSEPAVTCGRLDLQPQSVFLEKLGEPLVFHATGGDGTNYTFTVDPHGVGNEVAEGSTFRYTPVKANNFSGEVSARITVKSCPESPQTSASFIYNK